MKELFGRLHRRRSVRVTTIFLSLAAFVAGGTTVFAGSTNPGPGLENEQELRLEHQKTFLQQHSDAYGRVRPDLWRAGVQQFRDLPISATWHDGRASGAALAAPASASSGAITGAQWNQIGPAPLRIDAEQVFQGTGPDSGEVVGIAVDPRGATDQVIYIATNDGGVWKTTNGGTSWAPLTDSMPSLSMGDVALDPGNPSIVYAGTGNLFDGGGTFSKSVGIYKSLDGGGSWSVLNPGGIFNSRGVNRIVFAAANQLLVATNNGLYKSVDGGLTFGNNSPSFNNNAAVLNGFISDLDLDPANSANVYASVSGSGVFRSTDSGATFPTNLFSNPGSPGTSGFGNLGFAVGTSDNQRMYALVQNSGTCATLFPSNPNRCANVYRSNDGGANWTNPTDGANRSIENNGCQCGYDLMIGVDPLDEDRVYIAFQELYVSTDGANSFGTPAATRNLVHWDHHAMTFTPASHYGGSGPPTRLYVGTDGGLATTGNGGTSWSNINEGIATNLFFQIDIGRGSAGNNQYSYGGTQDTGTIDHRPGDAGTDWHLGIDGDGGAITVDPSNPQVAYMGGNNCYRKTTDGGNTWPTPPGVPGGVCAGQVAVDPNNGNNVFVASATTLYRSTTGGGNLSSIGTLPAAITDIDTSKVDSNSLWLGLNNGQVATTTDALAATPTFTTFTVPGAPGQRAAVAADPTNAAQAVVVYTGFTGVVGGVSKHVFQTLDGGATWSNISGVTGGLQNLPDLPLHSAVIDPGTTPHSVIVSSDAGVARTLDGGGTWQQLGVGLPAVDSKSLQIDTGVNPPVLRIGTYGRSVFELTTPSGPQLAVNTDLGFGNVGLGQRATRIVQVFNVGTSDLHISGFSRLSGSLTFSLVSGPPTPATIQPGEELDWTIQFLPTTRGNQTAIFHIQSDDPSQPDFQLPASGTGVTGKIAVSGSVDFGTVARGTSATRAVTVQNTGLAPLTVSGLSLLGGSDPAYSILTNPGTAQTIEPSDSVVFTLLFAPPASSNASPRTATLRIASDDPDAPNVDLGATGMPGVPKTVLDSSSFDFGGVPVDNRTAPHTADRVLRITNEASCILCDLTVTSLPITGANGAEFSLVGAPATPFSIGAGNHVDLTVRFNPPADGSRVATLTVNSDDPATPSIAVSLAGVGLLPAIASAPGTPTSPLIFGPTVYDPNCGIFCGRTQTEIFTNTGQAELIADTVSFTGSPAFSGPGPSSPPDRFAPTSSLVEPVTFHPTAPARKVTGTLTLRDELPLDSITVERQVPLCGEAVGRGVRLLVEDNAGNPVPSLSDLHLQSTGTSPNVNINIMGPINLQTIDPPTSCQRIQFHYENQQLPATEEAAPKSSYFTFNVGAGGNRKATVTFTLGANEFRQIVMVVDTVPPTIFAPAVVNATTTSSKGRRVAFRVRAVDNRDGRVAVKCRPRSGGFFRIGTTRVTCRAHDRWSNVAVRHLRVIVRHRPAAPGIRR